MTKLHKTITALILAAALLLSGCAEQRNSPAQGTENTSSDSNTVSTEPEASTLGSEPQNSSEGSSDVSDDTVPVEFTEEDKELEKILEGLGSYDVIYAWLCGAGPFMSDDPVSSIYNFLFTEKFDYPFTPPYTKIPDNYSEMGRIIPHTYEGIKEVMLECFTEEYTNHLMSLEVTKGSITENSDGSFSVKILDENFSGIKSPKFVEIDGIMYRDAGEGFNHSLSNGIAQHTVKVISKTEDTIEFNYLDNHWALADDNEIYLNDVSLYNQNAKIGVLKYERGGWRRDRDKT